MKRNLQVIDVTGVASTTPAGKTVFTLPNFAGGVRIHSILQVLTAASTAITVNFPGDTTIRVNGTTQRQLTLTQTDGLNALNNPPSATYGTAAATPYTKNFPSATRCDLEHYFSEPWIPMGLGERFALDLFENEVCTVETEYAAVTPAATSICRVVYEPLAEVRASGRKLNRIATGPNSSRATLVKHVRSQETPGAITHTMQKLNKVFNGSETIRSIRLLEPTSRTIESVIVKLNDQDIFNRDKWENGKELRSAGMNPTASSAGAGAFDIVPQASDSNRDGWLVNANDKLDVIITYDSAASIAQVAIVDVFGPVF
jgi:hypothetical protein